MAAKPKRNPPAGAVAGAATPATAIPGPNSPTASAEEDSWLASSDPRKRLLGRLLLAGVWLYVGALWLLALDQTFGWGIFGPQTSTPP